MNTHDLRARLAPRAAAAVTTGPLMQGLHEAKSFVRKGSLLLVALLGVSCSTRKKPDADWNSLRLWQQVANPPPNYVPAGYEANRPRTDRDGTWFTDPRDGKRLFVPKDGVPGWPPGVLAGEAKKATGFDGKPRLTTREKLWWGTTALFGAMAGVKVPPPN